MAVNISFEPTSRLNSLFSPPLHAELPAYITFGLPRYSIDDLDEVARLLIKPGHARLKMVVATGTNPFDEILGQPTDADIVQDAARVAALREAVGPKIELMMDANKGATYAQALRLAKLCEPYNLTWFEYPVLRADPRLMAKLRTQTTIPLATGSTATSDLMYLREYLMRDAVDYLQPNVRDIGGYTQGIKAAALARDLMRELTAAIKEFGDLMKVSSEAVESEGVDRRENERIQREGWQVLRQTVMGMKLAEMQAGRKK